MMPSSEVRIAMVTTEDREAERARCLDSLGDASDITLVHDTKRALRANHMAAWRTIFSDPEVTHGMVLHDDIRAPKRWREVVDLFVATFPQQPAISFYSPRRAAAGSADTPGAHFMLDGGKWRNCQALLLHRDVLIGFTRWVMNEEYQDHLPPAQTHHLDLMLSAFLASRGVKVMVAAPSLFQHSGSSSSNGRPHGNRSRLHQAQDWPGEQWDALEYFRRRVTPRTLMGAAGQFQGF